MFCRHCGKPVEGGRFCSACGGPIAPYALDAMAAKLKRHGNEMLLIVVVLGLFFVISAGLIVRRVMHTERAAKGSLPGDEISAPVTQQQQPLPPPPVARISPIQPQQQPPQVAIPEESKPMSLPSTGSIDPNAVQNALTTLTKNGKQRAPSLQQRPASSAVPAGADRYPGSQPIEVKDVDLPDIGVPVTSEVYTSTDSLSTVVAYYTQRYPDAEVLETNGQKIIAVNRPGATKVIAIGTTGEETRIAILKQAN